MIKILNDEIAGYKFGKGAIVQLDQATESQLIATGDAEFYPVVSRPAEILFSAAVATACTNTTVQEILGSFSIPAGTLGVNSILQIEPVWTFTSSANSKVFSIKMGGATVFSRVRSAKTVEAPLVILANRNSLTSQIRPYSDNYMSGGIWTPATFAINFALTQDVEFTGLRESSSDSLQLEYYRVLHFVGD